jgi:uncharacterized protein (DUF2147 family)
MRKIFILAMLFITTMANCQVEKILGRWTTIDDKENIPVSIVNIYRGTDGKYYGKIEKILVKSEENKLCTECEGALHNKPVVGMIIVNNMEWRDGKLQGGTILDPDNGKTYYAKMWVDPATGKLILRGSLDKRGLLGRNQEWVRK